MLAFGFKATGPCPWKDDEMQEGWEWLSFDDEYLRRTGQEKKQAETFDEYYERIHNTKTGVLRLMGVSLLARHAEPGNVFILLTQFFMRTRPWEREVRLPNPLRSPTPEQLKSLKEVSLLMGIEWSEPAWHLLSDRAYLQEVLDG